MKTISLKWRTVLSVVCALSLLAMTPAPSWADGGVVFTDIASDPATGINYSRIPSTRDARRAFFLGALLPASNSFFFNALRPNSPQKSKGAPGIAVFDYDNDGDQDIFVTNGENAPHSLFSNQLVETGSLTFVNVAAMAGVEAVTQDGNGTCYADIDNDGDQDLYVLGAMSLTSSGDNILFENLGDGTFVDITATAGVAGDGRNSSGCSFGDVNNDGLIDLVVGNTYDNWAHRFPVFFAGPSYPRIDHNDLFINQGGNVFNDESTARGIENVSNMSGPGLRGGAVTWAIALVDYDQDGDLDMINADAQGGAKTQPSEERGWIRVFNNDGTGHFTDVTTSVGTNHEGGWMGLAFADANCDGHLDMFVTNLGDYLVPGARSSVYLGDANGNFSFGGPNEANGFGWGTVAFDYDNDADSDFAYFGGVDLFQFIVSDHFGTYVQNTGTCSGTYAYDLNGPAIDHRLRVDEGVATADLNDDGFFDVLTVSGLNYFPDNRFLSALGGNPPTGSIWDNFAANQFITSSTISPGNQVWANPGLQISQGTLSIEINSADNGNNWIKVQTRGSVDTLDDGSVNRNGIGALVSFTPDGGPTSILPILGGASYASQNSLEVGFGLGAGTQGTLEVLWPGGVRNRLYDVQAGETVQLPEIPCSFDGNWKNQGQYVKCVVHALNDLRGEGVISQAERDRFFHSAKQAFNDTQ